jgi:hypothetical protein
MLNQFLNLHPMSDEELRVKSMEFAIAISNQDMPSVPVLRVSVNPLTLTEIIYAFFKTVKFPNAE